MASKNVLQRRVGKYYLGRTIGEGQFSKVKYGQHVETGEAVAVKVLDKEHLIRTGMVEQIKREITILKQIHHPNIVDLKEVMASKDKIFVVMELVTGGELFDQIVAEGPKKEHDARVVFAQLLDALEHCHQQGVYHRDLKPENVLLSSSGQIKLSDFGLGALPDSVREDGLLRTTCGTPNYVAPEVLAKRGYQGGPADVWSLGVVLYVMLAGCLPFDEDDLPSLFRAISAAQYEVPPWLSPQATHILSRMLDPNPHARATLEELWAHPWVKARHGQVAATAGRAPGARALAHASSEDLFRVSVEPQMVAVQKGGQGKGITSPGRRLNAFELINAGLDISAIFEARDDVVTRRTRFTSQARPEAILHSVELATVAIGGRVERRGEGKLRLTIPNRKGPLTVNAEVFEVLPGKQITDLSKVSGNTVEFYKWYGDLVRAVGPLIAGEGAGAAARAGAASARATGGVPSALGSPGRRMNAFELLNCCSALNVGIIFENAGEEAGARHVQFTSQKSPDEIMEAIEVAVGSLGGTPVRLGGGNKLSLVVPISGDSTGRSLVMCATLMELRPRLHVVKISKALGASMEFFKFYGQLASLVQHIMTKKVPHPHATLLMPAPSTASSEPGDTSATLADALSGRSMSTASSGDELPSPSSPQALSSAVPLANGHHHAAEGPPPNTPPPVAARRELANGEDVAPCTPPTAGAAASNGGESGHLGLAGVGPAAGCGEAQQLPHQVQRLSLGKGR